MMKSKGILSMLFIAFICSSCDKVIDVKLDGSSSQVVIEGEITANKGPYTVKVSESKNFSEDNTFPGRDDAIVSIRDLKTGVSETLKSVGSGAYQTNTMLGVGGNSYQLTVELAGKTYTATSTIPKTAVRIERLFAKKFALDNDDIYMVPVFKDPVGKGNYYRIRQWVGGVLIKGSFVRNDEASDGRQFDGQLFYSTDAADGNPLITNGSIMKAELQCIDQAVYDYYRTLSNTIDQDSSTPSNPLSNITGGAIGVFNACRSNTITATAKF